MKVLNTFLFTNISNLLNLSRTSEQILCPFGQTIILVSRSAAHTENVHLQDFWGQLNKTPLFSDFHFSEARDFFKKGNNDDVGVEDSIAFVRMGDS